MEIICFHSRKNALLDYFEKPTEVWDFINVAAKFETFIVQTMKSIAAILIQLASTVL